MPPKTKKERKCNQHTESRWHDIHFSGKLILCSVIFGLMLVLVGGIVMAIGSDNDDDTKTDHYEDVQKKPPMPIVGSVLMGIGGFTVIVGVIMCLVETKVCRRRTTDTNPLIGGEAGESTARASIDVGKNSNHAAIPSTSRHHEKHHHGHKPPSPRKSKKSSKNGNANVTPSPKSQPSTPISVTAGNSKHFLSLSDKFLTPTNSFPQDSLPLQSNSQDAEVQTSTSLMKSFTSSGMSWNASTEFQTPDASFNGNSLSLEINPINEGSPTLLLATNRPGVSNLGIDKHEFLTPKNSDAENITSPPLPSKEPEENTGITVLVSSLEGTKISQSEMTDPIEISPEGGFQKDLKLLNKPIDSDLSVHLTASELSKDRLGNDVSKNNTNHNSQNMNSFDALSVSASTAKASVIPPDADISIDVRKSEIQKLDMLTEVSVTEVKSDLTCQDKEDRETYSKNVTRKNLTETDLLVGLSPKENVDTMPSKETIGIVSNHEDEHTDQITVIEDLGKKENSELLNEQAHSQLITEETNVSEIKYEASDTEHADNTTSSTDMQSVNESDSLSDKSVSNEPQKEDISVT